jgi:hypothetical protein
MESATVDLPLIDEAALHVAISVAPGGGAWTVETSQRVSGTGWDMELQLWASGEHRRHVALRGPSVTGLSDADLDAERQRLVRVRDAAVAALAAVEGHQAFRRGLR